MKVIKQRPNRIFYIILLLLSMAVCAITFAISQESRWFVIISGIACGSFASVIIAWLIDAMHCKQLNIKKQQQFQSITYVYCEHIKELQHYIVTKGQQLLNTKENRSLPEWLEILNKILDQQSHGVSKPVDKLEAIRQENYRNIIFKVKIILNDINMLLSQTALLVIDELIDQKKFVQHFEQQRIICEIIINQEYIGNYFEFINDDVVSLIDNYKKVFEQEHDGVDKQI